MLKSNRNVVTLALGLLLSGVVATDAHAAVSPGRKAKIEQAIGNLFAVILTEGQEQMSWTCAIERSKAYLNQLALIDPANAESHQKVAQGLDGMMNETSGIKIIGLLISYLSSLPQSVKERFDEVSMFKIRQSINHSVDLNAQNAEGSYCIAKKAGSSGHNEL